MANVQPSVDFFLGELQSIEKAFNKDLTKLATQLKSATETELINATRQLNLLQELLDAGLTDALDGFDGEYTKMLSLAIKEAEKRGLPALSGASVEGLEVLRDLNYQRLLGQFGEYAKDLEIGLFRGIYANQSISNITSSLENINLLSHQLNLIVYDGIKIFDDMARKKVFEGLDVKWIYLGADDEVTRDACKATLRDDRNSPSEGFTQNEVENLKTPFGIRGGFNCRHSWEIV